MVASASGFDLNALGVRLRTQWAGRRNDNSFVVQLRLDVPEKPEANALKPDLSGRRRSRLPWRSAFLCRGGFGCVAVDPAFQRLDVDGRT
jgi:hypothetical protein